MSINTAAEILNSAKEEALESLEEFPMLHIKVKVGMERLVNSLNFVSGNGTTATGDKVEFPPMTSMFGKKIEAPKKVEPEQIQPLQEERQKLIDKVNTLQSNIATLENEKILENYVTKEDKQAIRGLAKRAGLEDFKTAELNGEYLDLIREGLRVNAEKLQAKEAQAVVDAKATKQDPDLLK